MLLELRFDQRKGERRSVERSIDVRQHVRHGADVIFVTVGEHERFDLSLPGLEVVEVRHDQIDTREIGLREHRSGVNDDSRVPTRDGHHVEAELAEAAERHDVNWRRATVGARGHTHAKSQPGRQDALGYLFNREVRSWRITGTTLVQAAGSACSYGGIFVGKYRTVSNYGGLEAAA